MKKWPIYSDFSILSHNSGNFGQNEKQVLFSEGATSGTEPNRFPESSSVMCHNVVYQWSGSEHCPTIPLQAHCGLGGGVVTLIIRQEILPADVTYRYQYLV